MMSFSCVGPQNTWAHEHFVHSIKCWSRWDIQLRPTILGGSVTLCQDMSQLATLEPTGNHFVVCHGLLSTQEKAYIERLPAETRIFTATGEGYLSHAESDIDTLYAPEKLWDIFISALYGD